MNAPARTFPISVLHVDYQSPPGHPLTRGLEIGFTDRDSMWIAVYDCTKKVADPGGGQLGGYELMGRIDLPRECFIHLKRALGDAWEEAVPESEASSQTKEESQ